MEITIENILSTFTGAPWFYNDKECNATYYLNNFDLV